MFFSSDLIDSQFVSYLLDLIEHTRTDDAEMLNHAAARLVLAVNEQFMVQQSLCAEEGEYDNAVIDMLGARPGYKTFGEDVAFLLNRASQDHSLQLLILKLLFAIFTTQETYDFFYTNDLRVLADLVVRGVRDLPGEAELLRHAYLRVLGPMFANTPLRNASDKRESVRRLLCDLVCENRNYGHTISSTTRRLVERVHRVIETTPNEVNPVSTHVNREKRKVSVPETANYATAAVSGSSYIDSPFSSASESTLCNPFEAPSVYLENEPNTAISASNHSTTGIIEENSSPTFSSEGATLTHSSGLMVERGLSNSLIV